MSSSILTSTKKLLGLAADDTSFDTDVTLFINSAIADLTQLGIGPSGGFSIQDAAATWEDLLGEDPKMNGAKELVYLKVKLAFDPPPTSFGINAIESLIAKGEWRLNVQRESTHWVDPNPADLSDDVMGGPIIIDGGVG